VCRKAEFIDTKIILIDISSKKEEELNRIRMNALYQFKLGWMATSA
jgi:hypothetical protein